MRQIVKKFTLVFFAAILLILSSCSGNQAISLHKSNRLLMGTIVEVTVVGSDDRAKELIHAIFDELQRIENLTSFHKSSDLTILNEQASNSISRVDQELLTIIDRAIGVAQETDGAFDPTVGPLSLLWHFSGGDPYLPTQREIDDALKKVGWKHVKIDRSNEVVSFLKNGMCLDLGGIVKGYALDRVSTIIRNSGVSGALVNIGGDVLAIGEKAPGKPWRIGVRDPRDPKGLIAIAETKDRMILSSGDYERFFERDGRRYHHILDPRTGYPVEGVQSVTLVTEEGMKIPSCAVFALGVERGLKHLENIPGVEALIVDGNGKIHKTRGAAAFFKIDQK